MTDRADSPLSQERKTIGVARDLQRIQEHSSSSLVELREFVRQLQGRKASEVLGIVTGSPLIRATAEATLYLAILLVVLTVVPFMMSGSKDKPVAATETQAAAGNDTPVTNAVAENTAPAAGSDGAISAENAKKAVDVMGLEDTKMADPDKNPLDNLDKLLDDVK